VLDVFVRAPSAAAFHDNKETIRHRSHYLMLLLSSSGRLFPCSSFSVSVLQASSADVMRSVAALSQNRCARHHLYLLTRFSIFWLDDLVGSLLLRGRQPITVWSARRVLARVTYSGHARTIHATELAAGEIGMV